VASRTASPQSGGNSISAGCPYGFKLSFYKQGLFAIFEKDRRTSRSEDGSLESDTLNEVAMTDADVHGDSPRPVFM